MAFTVTQRRTSNPGPSTRIYAVTSTDADTITTFSHGLSFTPDYWVIQSSDDTGAMYSGLWRASCTSTTVTVSKASAASAGGTCRLMITRAPEIGQ